MEINDSIFKLFHLLQKIYLSQCFVIIKLESAIIVHYFQNLIYSQLFKTLYEIKKYKPAYQITQCIVSPLSDLDYTSND